MDSQRNREPRDAQNGYAALLSVSTEPKERIPPEVFQAAVRTHLECRRLDMQELAAELGIARSTLYRKVESRDQLLGAVLWHLVQHALVPALHAAEGLTGVERIQAIAGQFMKLIHGQPAFRRLLESEPEAALRILTSKHGPVQQRLVEFSERILAEEESRGSLQLTMDRNAMAYLIVRIGETFLYADVIADNEPDLELAVDLIGRLLRSERLAT